MTDDTNTPSTDDRSFRAGNKELNRLLIKEFYEDSVGRYGADSEQACTLARLLSPSDCRGPKKKTDSVHSRFPRL
jgi:hypothetical protein